MFSSLRIYTKQHQHQQHQQRRQQRKQLFSCVAHWEAFGFPLLYLFLYLFSRLSQTWCHCDENLVHKFLMK
jgi:hypothetical protein